MTINSSNEFKDEPEFISPISHQDTSLPLAEETYVVGDDVDKMLIVHIPKLGLDEGLYHQYREFTKALIVDQIADLYFASNPTESLELSLTATSISEKENRAIIFLNSKEKSNLLRNLTTLFASIKDRADSEMQGTDAMVLLEGAIAEGLEISKQGRQTWKEKWALIKDKKAQLEVVKGTAAADQLKAEIGQLERENLGLQRDEELNQKRAMEEDLLFSTQRWKSWTPDDLFAHIHGDVFIKSTGLEGSGSIIPLYYLTDFLNEKCLPSPHFSDRTKAAIEVYIKKLMVAMEIEEDRLSIHRDPNVDRPKNRQQIAVLADKLIERTQKLAKGESFLIAGGWVGQPSGHAIYYEIAKGPQIFNDRCKLVDSYSFKAYNLGEGSYNHPSLEIEGHVKYFPYLEYQQILEEKFNRTFFIPLLETLTFVKVVSSDPVPDATHYSERDLYEIIFPRLKGKMVDHSDEIDKYILPHVSGTCTMVSLLATLRSQLTPQEFARFDYEFGKQALIDYFEQYRNPLDKVDSTGIRLLFHFEEVEERRLLLQKSAEQFARTSLSHYNEGIITLDELVKTNQIVNVILRTLNRAEGIYHKREYAKGLQLHFNHLATLSGPVQMVADMSDKDFEAQGFGQMTNAQWDLSWQPDPKNISQDLIRFDQLCQQEMLQGRSYQTALFIMNLFDALPSLQSAKSTISQSISITSYEQEFWDLIPAKEIGSCMEKLTALSEKLILTSVLTDTYRNPFQHQSRIFSLLKMIAIQRHLGLLSEFGRENEEFFALGPNLREVSAFFYRLRVGDEFEVDYTDVRHPGSGGDGSVYSIKRKNEALDALNRISSGISAPAFFKGSFDDLTRDADHNPEIKFVYHYWQSHSKEFDQVYPEVIGTNVSDPLDCVAHALTDLTGKFLPKEYCFYKKQALMFQYFLEGNLDGFLYGPFDLSANKTINYYKASYQIRPTQDFSEESADKLPLFICEFNNMYWKFDPRPNQELPVNRLLARIEGEEKTALTSLIALGQYDEGHYPLELRIIKAIDYFSVNTQKLYERDYQLFLQQILFAEDFLSKLLLKNPESALRLVDFIERGVQISFQGNVSGPHVKGATFFLNLAILFREQFESLRGQNLKSKAIEEAIQALDQKFLMHESFDSLFKAAKNATERSLVHQQLLHYYSTNAVARNQNIEEILFSLTYLHSHPIPEALKDPYSEDEIEKLGSQVILDSHNLMKEPVKAKRLMQAMIKEIAKEEVNAEVSWLPPLYQCGNYSFSCETMSLYSESGLLSLLPASISTNADFNRIFPPQDYVATMINPGVYQLRDNQGVETRIVQDQKGPLIYKKLTATGTWYKYLPAKVMQESVKSKQLTEDKTAWQGNEGKEILFCDLHSNHVTHRAICANGAIQAIEPLNQPGVRLADLYLLPMPPNLAALQNFDRADQQLLWIDQEETPVKLEIPRYHLSFTFDPETKEAKCDQIANYHLDTHQKVRGFRSLTSYLVLRSGNQRKVLIPTQEIDSHDDHLMTGSLTSEISLLQKAPKGKPGYYLYDVNGNGEVASQNCEENLFLAYLLFGEKQYVKAQTLLRDYGTKLQPYQLTERAIFSQISQLYKKNLDGDPKASAVFLTAAAIYLRNLREQGQRKDSSLDSHFKEAYDHYLSIVEHTTSLALSVEEEREILRILMTDPADLLSKRYSQRINFLAGDVSSTGYIKWFPPVGTQGFYKTKEKLLKALEEMMLDDQSTTISPELYDPATLFTRPGNLINQVRKSFFTIYDQIKKGTLDKRVAETILGRIHPHMNSTDENNFPIKVLYFLYSSPSYYPSMDNLEQAAEQIFSQMSQLNEQINLSTHSNSPTPFIDGAPVKLSTPTNKLSTSQIPSETIPQSTFLIPEIDLSSGKTTLVKSLFNREAGQPMAVADSGQLTHYFEANNQAPFAQEESAQICAGINRYLNKAPSPTYELRGLERILDKSEGERRQQIKSELFKARRELVIQNAELNKLQSILILEALQMANKMESVIHQTEILATKKREVSFNDLIISFLKGDFQDFKRLNPNLTNEEILQIKKLVEGALIRGSEMHGMGRRLTALDELEEEISSKAPNERLDEDLVIQELSNKLAKELETKRVNYDARHFQYLVFEYVTGMQLRKDQIENLDKMTSSKVPDMIMQMIMGSGKTKVLLPILALMKADGDRLPIIVLPEAMYETTLHDMQISERETFHKAVRTLTFDRNTEFTASNLKEILRKMESIRQNRECLIMTSKSLQSLSLKFQEAIIDYTNDPSPLYLEKLQLLQSILKLIRDKGDAIIDEVDQVLNCRYELNFALGNASSLDQNRYDLTLDLYQLLAFDKEIASLMNFNLDSNQEARSFNEIDYHLKVKPALLHAYLNKVNTDSNHPLHAGVNSDREGRITQYILGSIDSPDLPDLALNDATCMQLLAVVKGQLNELLPLTLDKKCHINYGPSLSTSTVLAIPYKGNISPVEGSQFGNPYELLNYTIQMYFRYGIPEKQIEERINAIKEQIDAELERNPAVKIQNTKAYQELSWLCGDRGIIDLANYTPEDIKGIAAMWNSDRSTRFNSYLNRYVMPEVKIQAEKLNSTSQDLVEMFGTVIGFTGTPWNSSSFPEKLRDNTVANVEVDGTTAALLWSKSRDKVAILKATKEPAALVQELLASHLVSGVNALIDTGASFDGIANQVVATYLLDILLPFKKIQGVRFFNENNEAVVMRRLLDGSLHIGKETETLLKSEEIFSYFDELHTTGVDAKHPLNAVGVVTIGKNMSYRTLAQGVWRLRGLEKQQQVHFKIIPEALDEIRALNGLSEKDQINVGHLLRFTFNNQLKQQMEHLISSTKQKIQHSVKQALIDRFLDIDFNSSKGLYTYQEAIPFWITKNKDDPYSIYGKKVTPEKTEDLLELVKKQNLDQLKSLSENSPLFNGQKAFFVAVISEKMGESTKEVAKLLPNILPSSFAADTSNADSRVELEQEQQQVAEITVQTLEQISGLVKKQTFGWQWGLRGYYGNVKDETDGIGKWTPFDPEFYQTTPAADVAHRRVNADRRLFSIEEVLGSIPELKEFASLAKHMITTCNAIDIRVDGGNELTPLQLFSQREYPTQYALLIRDKETSEVRLQLLSTHFDMGYFYNYFVKNMNYRNELQITLCDLNGRGILGEPMQGQDINELLIRAKLLTGILEFSEAEQKVLAKVIGEQGKESLLRLLTEYVLPHHPREKALFEKSNLYQQLS